MSHLAANRVLWVGLFSVLIACGGIPARGQSADSSGEVERLRQMVVDLQQRVAVLEAERRGQPSAAGGSGDSDPRAAAALVTAVAELRPAASSVTAEPSGAINSGAAPQSSVAVSHEPAGLPGGATLNYYLDGYYENNFNNPAGGVNDLRAYDVLSHAFSINQTGLVFDWEPEPAAHRRYGFRVDLQFGQATATLQGNPANEPRPDIYRNIFQAYGSYVIPAGSGLHVDVGKWASSLGIEGNYTKDQMNYSRSWYFNFLPFYHEGVRTSYAVNHWMTANYWIVNGANQTEPTNGYKDEMFGVVLQPASSVSWTINSYLGQENPDAAPGTACSVPVQPGLCVTPIRPAPNGKLHILDSYATWQASKNLELAGEGDYVIQRVWASAAPGESSAPSHVDGGAAYAQYQLTPRYALALRTEYLSDPDGLFSGASQALKEVTGTYKVSLGDNFDVFLEYRHDWSNRRYFITDHPASPSGQQDTAGIGLVWWYGGKQGSW
ncbi:MAG TPA: outer membrane beta-barrel protein [Acidobacteriaceae bacterium]